MSMRELRAKERRSVPLKPQHKTNPPSVSTRKVVSKTGNTTEKTPCYLMGDLFSVEALVAPTSSPLPLAPSYSLVKGGLQGRPFHSVISLSLFLLSKVSSSSFTPSPFKTL